MHVDVDASTSLPAPYSRRQYVIAACKCGHCVKVYTDLIIASFYSMRQTAMVVMIVKGVMGMIGSNRERMPLEEPLS